MLFLNGVSPLCPHRFVAQLPKSFGVWDFFYFFCFTVAFAFEQQTRAQPQHYGKAKVSSQPNTATLQLLHHCKKLGLQNQPKPGPSTKDAFFALCGYKPKDQRTSAEICSGQQILAATTELQCSRANLPTHWWSSAPKTTDPDFFRVSHGDTEDKFGPRGCSTAAVKATLGAPNRSELRSCSGTDAESFSLRDRCSLNRDVTTS